MHTHPRSRVVAPLLVLLGTTACGDAEDDDDGAAQDSGDESDDPRCQMLCEPATDVCNADHCLAACGSRLVGVSPLCGTCMLEDAFRLQESCVPSYPDPLECEATCAESSGPAPSPHPICTEACAFQCAPEQDDCLTLCQARVEGVDAYCAMCLLEGTVLLSTVGDCYEIQYQRDVEECAPACG
jgi:hypothetical protein